MKKLLLLSTACAVALATGHAVAGETGSGAHHTLDTQEIHAHSLSGAAREAFQAARGLYAMEDGSTLRLYQRGLRYVAEVSGQAPMEVTVSRSGAFVAVNGTAELKFIESAHGEAAGVVLTKLRKPG